MHLLAKKGSERKGAAKLAGMHKPPTNHTGLEPKLILHQCCFQVEVTFTTLGVRMNLLVTPLAGLHQHKQTRTNVYVQAP